MKPNICNFLFIITVVLLLQAILLYVVLDLSVQKLSCRVFLSDTITLQLSSLSENVLEWGENIHSHLNDASTSTEKIAGDFYNYRSLHSLGQHNEDVAIYFPSSMDDPDNAGTKFAKQEPDKFAKADVQKLAKNVPDVELSLMELDFPTKLWTNPAIHLQMQTKLKSAVVAIAHKHPLIGPRFLLLQAQVKDPGDLYQGSRAVANMFAAMAQYLEEQKLQPTVACSQLILTLRDTEPLTIGDFVASVRDVERYIQLFELAEIKGSDAMFTADLVAAVKNKQNHLVVKAMTSPSEPKTIADLVKRLADLPMHSVPECEELRNQLLAGVNTSGSYPPSGTGPQEVCWKRNVEFLFPLRLLSRDSDLRGSAPALLKIEFLARPLKSR